MNFKELPIKEAMVLKQTLAAAHGAARCLAVMFPMHDNDMVPTAAQAALSEEILSDALNNYIIPDENLPFIHTTLSFMLDTFQTYTKYGADDEMSGHEFIMRMYGIDFNEEFEKILFDNIQKLSGTEPIELHNIHDIGSASIFNNYVVDAINGMQKDPDNLSRFYVRIIFNNRSFTFPPIASVYNGLLDLAKYIISEF